MMKKLMLFLLLFQTTLALFSEKNACGQFVYRNNNTGECEKCHETCRQCRGPGEHQCIHCISKYKKCNTTLGDDYYCKPLDFKCDVEFVDVVESGVIQIDINNLYVIILVIVGFMILIVVLVVVLTRAVIKRSCCRRNTHPPIEEGANERMLMIDLNKKEEKKMRSSNSKIRHGRLEWNEKDIINSGTFGNVYKGYLRQGGTSLTVAIKQSKNPKSDGPFKEFRIMAETRDHRHIIKLITTKMDDSLLLIMPLRIDNLSNYLETAKEITIMHKIRYCQQIAQGMAHLVSKEIIHCDLKASNILVVNENWVQISDFGSAQKFEDRKRTLGTITHTAMELFDLSISVTNSEATDVWSFGVTVWEIFNDKKRVPYANVLKKNITETSLFIYLKNRNHLETIYWPSENNFTVLVSIKSSMLQCWCRDADGRPNFQTLSESFSSKLTKR